MFSRPLGGYPAALIHAQLTPRTCILQETGEECSYFRKTSHCRGDHRDQFPTGLLRAVYRSLARAYTTLGQPAPAHAALERSGYPSLSAEEPQFITDAWMTADDGFRFGLPRLVEMAPRVFVAQGYDFADFAFVLTDDGVVAIDAGTTPAHVEAALVELRKITPLPVTRR